MLARVHIDNYKALVNFDLPLPQRCLFLGANGSGKSSVFEVVELLRGLMQGADLMSGDSSRVPAQTLTRWQNRQQQVFELSAKLGEHLFRYRLVIGHRPDMSDCRIDAESLHCDGDKVLFASEVGRAQLYRDNGSKGPEVLLDWNRSSLPILAGRKDNQLLTQFVNWLGRQVLMCRIHPDPRSMQSLSERPSVQLAADLSNFASFWRHIHEEDAEASSHLRGYLADSLPGFRGLEFRKVSEKAARLTARFADTSYGFEELSDGQRVLIVLYGLLVATRGRPFSLFLDEPDNFVAHREIQPFFNALEECSTLQIVLISHHPTLANLMAMESGVIFRRAPNAPTRVEAFSAPTGSTLSAGELLAQGFFDEST